MARRNGAADLDHLRHGRPGHRMTGALARIGRNWRALVNNGKTLARIDDTKTAFGVYSFVEAAIFVVVVGVLVLLWARAERKAFHLPGGDGTVIMGAGLWVMFLIFYRQLDKPNGRHEGLIQTSIGVDWGIFIAFLLGALLAYAGYRLRAAHVPEPVVDDAPPPAAEPVPAPAAAARRREAEEREEGGGPDTEATVVARRRRPQPTDDVLDGQLSFDEPAEYRPPPRRG